MSSYSARSGTALIGVGLGGPRRGTTAGYVISTTSDNLVSVLLWHYIKWANAVAAIALCCTSSKCPPNCESAIGAIFRTFRDDRMFPLASISFVYCAD